MSENPLVFLASKLHNAPSLSGDYDIHSIFPPAFIAEHSKYTNIAELMEGIGVEDFEALENTPIDELDEKISQSTSFSSWETMLDEALKSLVMKSMFGGEEA